MKATITRPLSTATPDKAIKPTPAEIDKGMSRNHKENTPPVRASGTPLKIIKASLIEPNAITNKATMIASVTGTTIARR